MFISIINTLFAALSNLRKNLGVSLMLFLPFLAGSSSNIYAKWLAKARSYLRPPTLETLKSDSTFMDSINFLV